MKKVNKKDSNIAYWIMFTIAAFMIFLDGMVTTPIALVCVDGAYEANIWHQHWSKSFGVKYFFYSTPMTILIIFVLSQGVEKISYELLKKKPKYADKYHWPTYVLLGIIIVLFGSVVISNFEVISNGIR